MTLKVSAMRNAVIMLMVLSWMCLVSVQISAQEPTAVPEDVLVPGSTGESYGTQNSQTPYTPEPAPALTVTPEAVTASPAATPESSSREIREQEALAHVKASIAQQRKLTAWLVLLLALSLAGNFALYLLLRQAQSIRFIDGQGLYKLEALNVFLARWMKSAEGDKQSESEDLEIQTLKPSELPPQELKF